MGEEPFKKTNLVSGMSAWRARIIFSVMRREEKGMGRSYVPYKWQALEVQEGDDESEELPDTSLASEAQLAAQSRQGRRHCLDWEGLVTCLDAVRTVVRTQRSGFNNKRA